MNPIPTPVHIAQNLCFHICSGLNISHQPQSNILAIQWVCLFSNCYQRHLTLGTRNRQRSLKRFSILFPMIEIQYSIWNIPGILVQVFSNLTFSKSLDEQSKIHGSYTWFPLLPSDIFSKRKRCWGTFLKQKYSRNDWSIFSELPTIYQNRKIYVFLQFCFRNIWYNLLLKVVMGITAFAVNSGQGQDVWQIFAEKFFLSLTTWAIGQKIVVSILAFHCKRSDSHYDF